MPPVTVTSMLPLASPLQDGETVVLAMTGRGSTITVAVVVDEQPAEVVTVNVYVPLCEKVLVAAFGVLPPLQR